MKQLDTYLHIIATTLIFVGIVVNLWLTVIGVAIAVILILWR